MGNNNKDHKTGVIKTNSQAVSKTGHNNIPRKTGMRRDHNKTGTATGHPSSKAATSNKDLRKRIVRVKSLKELTHKTDRSNLLPKTGMGRGYNKIKKVSGLLINAITNNKN